MKDKLCQQTKYINFMMEMEESVRESLLMMIL